MNRNKYYFILKAGLEQINWLIYDQAKNLVAQHSLSTQKDVLSGLRSLLGKRKISLSQAAGFGLLCLPAGLTSVKIWCTIINSLGWSIGQPVAAIFYPSQSKNVEVELIAKIINQSKYQPIKPVYQYRPDIVIAKAPSKYKLVK